MAANAQQSTVQRSATDLKQLMRSHHSALVSKLLHSQVAQAKTTAVNERLESYAIYQSDGSTFSIADSSKYWYTHPRGSVFDFTDMEFDDYSDAPKVQSDSLVNYTIGSNSFSLSRGNVSTYNASGKLQSQIVLISTPPGTPLSNSAQDLFIYDGAGNILTKYTLQWNGTSWDSSGKEEYTYNASNKPLTDIQADYNSGSWTPYQKREMTYDGSGNMTELVEYNYSGSTPVISDHSLLTYYSNNKVQTNLYEEYDGSGYVPSTIDSFGYNGTDFYTFDDYREWNVDSNRWDKSSLETRHLNASVLPDTIYYYGVDTATNDYIVQFYTTWKYNSNNDPVETAGTLEYMGNSMELLHYYYHYEARWDLGVKDFAKNSSFTIYPNPATNDLYIKAKQVTAGTVVARVMNSVGQVVMQTTLQGSDNMKLSIAALQPGSYHLSLADTKGNSLMAQSFIKQ